MVAFSAIDGEDGGIIILLAMVMTKILLSDILTSYSNKLFGFPLAMTLFCFALREIDQPFVASCVYFEMRDFLFLSDF